MNNLKMILQDGTTINITEFAFPMHVVTHCETKEEALAIWDKFTEKNLTSVQIQQQDEVLFAYQYAGLTGAQYIINSDNTITAHFYFDGERVANPDAEYVEAAKILLGEAE